jgi:hypothetical protein
MNLIQSQGAYQLADSAMGKWLPEKDSNLQRPRSERGGLPIVLSGNGG